MTLYKIDFEPVGRRGQCLAGQSLLDCMRQLGMGLVSLCGGKGSCGHCKVQVVAGRISKPTPNERKALSSQELEDGYRLACQTYTLSDCKLRVLPESLTAPQRTQVEGLEVTIRPEPSVCAYKVQLSPPSLSDLQADADRLLEALEYQHQVCCRTIDIEVLRDLSPRLRSWNWQARASVRGDEVVALRRAPGPAAN